MKKLYAALLAASLYASQSAYAECYDVKRVTDKELEVNAGATATEMGEVATKAFVGQLVKVFQWTPRDEDHAVVILQGDLVRIVFFSKGCAGRFIQVRLEVFNALMGRDA